MTSDWPEGLHALGIRRLILISWFEKLRVHLWLLDAITTMGTPKRLPPRTKNGSRFDTLPLLEAG